MSRNWFPILFLLGLSAILYAYRLGFPHEQYYDEVYHVKTAHEYLSLSGNTENTHPPFGKEMMALMIKVLGDKPWVWRFYALICGLACLGVFFLLAQRFFQQTSWAFCAASLLALDGIHLTQSRIAMLNTPMLLGMLLSVFFFIKIAENPEKIRHYFLFGISFGLAIATRWISVLVLPVLAMLCFLLFPKIKNYKKTAALFFAASLLAISLYFLTHSILFFIPGAEKNLWQYQKNMLDYHAHLSATHTYGSTWWGWPIMVRPIWYFFERQEPLVYGILCIANPLVIWMFFPALGYLVWNFFKTRNVKILFIFLGFLSQWLPWAFIGRVKFFHYFHTAMPFLILMVTFYLRDLWMSGKVGKIFTMGYLIGVLVMAFYWYPLWTAYPVDEMYFQNHLWFKNWI